jgi:hypothetical protein
MQALALNEHLNTATTTLDDANVIAHADMLMSRWTACKTEAYVLPPGPTAPTAMLVDPVSPQQLAAVTKGVGRLVQMDAWMAQGLALIGRTRRALGDPVIPWMGFGGSLETDAWTRRDSPLPSTDFDFEQTDTCVCCGEVEHVSCFRCNTCMVCCGCDVKCNKSKTTNVLRISGR